MPDKSDKLTTTVHVPDGEYSGPGEPGYDRQVLLITRQITFTSVVPITSYPDMDVPQAIAYEQELEMPEVIEALQFVDEQYDIGQRVDLRTHVAVRRVVS